MEAPPGWDDWHGLVGNSRYYNASIINSLLLPALSIIVVMSLSVPLLQMGCALCMGIALDSTMPLTFSSTMQRPFYKATWDSRRSKASHS